MKNKYVPKESNNQQKRIVTYEIKETEEGNLVVNLNGIAVILIFDDGSFARHTLFDSDKEKSGVITNSDNKIVEFKED